MPFMDLPRWGRTQLASPAPPTRMRILTRHALRACRRWSGGVCIETLKAHTDTVRCVLSG